jgi:hypothetical protein
MALITIDHERDRDYDHDHDHDRHRHRHRHDRLLRSKTRTGLDACGKIPGGSNPVSWPYFSQGCRCHKSDYFGL